MRGDRPGRQGVGAVPLHGAHSLLFAVIVGVITLVQAYLLPGMVP
jgi:hypothetical protein